MVDTEIQKQAELVKLLDRVYDSGVVQPESLKDKLLFPLNRDAKIRRALFTVAHELASSRGDNPGFAIVMPYSDKSMKQVTDYLIGVLGPEGAGVTNPFTQPQTGEVEKQASLVKLFGRVHDAGLITPESQGEKLLYLGSIRRNIRQAAFILAYELASHRGDNPGLAMVWPSSDKSMEKVTEYLSDVLRKQEASVAVPTSQEQPASEAVTTYFRDMVKRPQTQQQGVVPPTRA
jgi:hypothetical protein